jgi:hypothetical protein
MRRHLQGGESFLRDFEDRSGFLAHIGFGVMVACLLQFRTLIFTQADLESFGHGVSFLEQTGVPVILPHFLAYYQINLLMCII